MILLSDEESQVFHNEGNMKAPPGLPKEFDLNVIYDVAGRLSKMCGSGSNLDFSKRNDNELVNLRESKWKWKTIEQYGEEANGMPQEHVIYINIKSIVSSSFVNRPITQVIICYM